MVKFFGLLIMLISSATAMAQSTLLVVGDSISAGYGIEAEQGWVALWQKKLLAERLNYQVVNASISGETTSDNRNGELRAHVQIVDFAQQDTASPASGHTPPPRLRVVPKAGLARIPARARACRLLQPGSAVESQINEQSRNHQDHGARQSAKHLDDRCELPHLVQNLHLILVHLGFGFMEVDGIVLVHGKGAAIDQEDYEYSRQNTPRDKQPEHRRHTPPRS